MNSQPAPTAAAQIVWPSVVTVISAAILIGAEVFGAAFAGGGGLHAHKIGSCSGAAISPKSAHLSSAKGPKMPYGVI